MTSPRSVSELVTAIRAVLETDPDLSDAWVVGEVSNYFRSAAGHTYFSLRDTGAMIKCVLYRGRSRTTFKDGDEVIAHGRLSMYEPRGEIQLVADLVSSSGAGELQLQFEQLVARLNNEGLFDTARKRPLPEFPQRVGLITSPGGAVLHDILSILRRRYPLLEIVLAPVAVQGEAAPNEIRFAFDDLNTRDDIDLVILARGGGSAEDLSAFNDEGVARAIFASRHPVVSAVGHETDITVADYVADLRAPTPSAAAELIAPDRDELLLQVKAAREAIQSLAEGMVEDLTTRLGFAQMRLRRAAPDPVRLNSSVVQLQRRMAAAARFQTSVAAANLIGVRGKLDALSPAATLDRGYAVVEYNGRAVVESGQAPVDGTVQVTVSKGSFEAKVLSRQGRS